MRKIGTGNSQLPAEKKNAASPGRILWERELERLQNVSSGKVMAIAQRAADRAEQTANTLSGMRG